MPTSRPRTLFWIALLVGLLSLFCATASAASSPAAPSPSAKDDLICHTDNPAECYPKIFSATEEFQVIHDDQDLPPGLHVRMDIYSGTKEAKLMTPESDNPALEGLPVEQSVMVIEPEVAEEVPRIPQGAPAYEPVGAVKEPQVHNPDFIAALDTLKEHAEKRPIEKSQLFDDALVDLEDLSHDMYYGKKIIEDTDALKSLFCLLTQRDEPVSQRDFLASSILSSSLQNNPPALKELEVRWDSVMEMQCAFDTKPLKDTFFSGLKPLMYALNHPAEELLWMRRALPVLGKLLKSDVIRPKFMAADGMKHLMHILLIGDDGWVDLKRRVSRIVSDTFLDETAGAKIGLWPLDWACDPVACNTHPTTLEESCWEHHLNRLSQEPNAEWAHELLTLLVKARLDTGRVKDEL